MERTRLTVSFATALLDGHVDAFSTSATWTTSQLCVVHTAYRAAFKAAVDF